MFLRMSVIEFSLLMWFNERHVGRWSVEVGIVSDRLFTPKIDVAGMVNSDILLKLKRCRHELSMVHCLK